MKTALLFFFLFFITFAFAQEQDYTLKMTLGQTLNKPADFFITQDDNIFVADHFSYKLFNPEGKLIKEYFLDDAYAGRAVATDQQGNLYIVKEDEKVFKYAADGSLLMSFGSKGGAPGQLNGAQGIALDTEGNIYVADTYNNRIQKFDQHGILLQVFGEYGELSQPSRIKIDANNKLYILEDRRFQRLHPNGAPDIAISFIYSSNKGMAYDKEGHTFIWQLIFS